MESVPLSGDASTERTAGTAAAHRTRPVVGSTANPLHIAAASAGMDAGFVQFPTALANMWQAFGIIEGRRVLALAHSNVVATMQRGFVFERLDQREAILR
jgi:uncharacterized membrane protein YqiK